MLVRYPESETAQVKHSCLPDPQKLHEIIRCFNLLHFWNILIHSKNNKCSENCLSTGQFTIRNLGNLIELNFRKQQGLPRNGKLFCKLSQPYSLALWNGMVCYVCCIPSPTSHSYIGFSLFFLLKDHGLFVGWDYSGDTAALTPYTQPVPLSSWAPQPSVRRNSNPPSLGQAVHQL